MSTSDHAKRGRADGPRKGELILQTPLDKVLDLLACPACGGELLQGNESLSCVSCRAVYDISEAIPFLFAPTEGGTTDVTELVKSFYEEHPFPNYDDLDSEQSLIEKARQGLFGRLLDEQIPQGAAVLEVGCGTGQLSNFLGISWNRRVIGADVCRNSLRLAEEFRSRHGIKNASFVQMNLFRPPFKPNSFDIVVSIGVLHHTADARAAFRSIARLVKPGGAVIIGLYNRIGRLTTDFRRVLFRISGDRAAFLDSHMRNPNYNQERKRAWFLDQYKHPQESKHSYDEVLQWFEASGFEYLFSIPKVELGPFCPDEQLFARHHPGSRFSRLLTQVQMLLEGGVDGGLFIMIGRKLLAAAGQTDLVSVPDATAHGISG